MKPMARDDIAWMAPSFVIVDLNLAGSRRHKSFRLTLDSRDRTQIRAHGLAFHQEHVAFTIVCGNSSIVGNRNQVFTIF